MSTGAFRAKELKTFIGYEKGKPPQQQPYFGADAELYLTPDYLRGRGEAESVMASRDSVRISDGDTLVLWDGSNAGEILRGRNGILASTMALLTYDSSFEQDYFFFALKQWEPFLKGQTSGSGIPHVDKEILGKLEVIDFCKPEQTKIAEVLSMVDRVIERTERLLAKQERIKTGLIQDLLMKGIDERGNLRSEATHKFKDSPLGRIPVDWDLTEMGMVCSLITKGTTPKRRANESINCPIPFLRVQNITFHGDLNLSEELEFIDRATHVGELSRSRVFPGDVLQNIVGPPLGKVAVVPSDYQEWNINQAIAVFRPNGRILSAFLSEWLQSPAARAWFEMNSKKTSGQQNLTLEQCKQLPLVLPTPEEQTRLCSLIKQSVRMQEVDRRRLSSLHSLKTALMQDLLTGRKRVRPLLEMEPSC